MLDGESAVDAESSWTEILVGFRFGSNVRPGGRTRFCCLSFGRLGVAAVVVAIARSEVEVVGYQIFARHLPPSFSHNLKSTTTMSTTYSSYRRQPTTDQVHDKYRQKVQHLKELFPTWQTEGASSLPLHTRHAQLILFSPSDLSGLLAEVNGDIEVAATRITEGLLDTASRSFLFTEALSQRPSRTMGFRQSQEGQKAP